MASWPKIREMLERYSRTERLSDEMLRVSILLADEHGTEVDENGQRYAPWQVFVSREALPRKDGGPGLEFVSIDAPLSAVGHVDLMSAVGQVGQLAQGLLAYAQGTDSGALLVGTRMLADLLDAANPAPLILTLHSIGEAARAVTRELATEDGFYASRVQNIRQSAWQSVRQMVLNDGEFEVERDLSDAIIFWINGSRGRYRMFAALNQAGPGEQYVTFEYNLGAMQDVNLERAVQAAADTTGGVVCDDGFVSFRVSQHLTALTSGLFKISLAQLLIAIEKYTQ